MAVELPLKIGQVIYGLPSDLDGLQEGESIDEWICAYIAVGPALVVSWQYDEPAPKGGMVRVHVPGDWMYPTKRQAVQNRIESDHRYIADLQSQHAVANKQLDQLKDVTP